MFNLNDRVYIPGASGAPNALAAAVFGGKDLRVTTSYLPGVNPIKLEEIGPGTVVTGIFMQPSASEAQRRGVYRHLPVTYAAMLKHVESEPEFDVCVVQVSPPDANGMCSLGPLAEFTPAVLKRSKRIAAVINSNAPAIPNAPAVHISKIDHIVESDAPVTVYDVGEVDPAARVIARHVASLVRDGAALQVGIGKVPHALMEALHDRRNLRIHSGMVSDGVIGLQAAGALDKNWTHRTTAVLGSADLYAWAAGRADIRVAGVEEIHLPEILASVEGLVAVNSGLEVDLFGQCNLEFANGRAVSGCGGAPDFARGARMARGGFSVAALPATFGGGKGSRILAQFGERSVVTLGRTDVDVIVTEEGIADLRGRSVHERAEAIIAVAAPDARAGLTEQWRAIAARL